MVLYKLCHVGDKVRYSTTENGQRFLSDGVIQRVTKSGASMKCDGSHGWDEGLSLWIDKDTGFDFYWDLDRPW